MTDNKSPPAILEDIAARRAALLKRQQEELAALEEALDLDSRISNDCDHDLSAFGRLMSRYIDARLHTTDFGNLYAACGRLWNDTRPAPHGLGELIQAIVAPRDYFAWEERGATVGSAARMVRRHLNHQIIRRFMKSGMLDSKARVRVKALSRPLVMKEAA